MLQFAIVNSKVVFVMWWLHVILKHATVLTYLEKNGDFGSTRSAPRTLSSPCAPARPPAPRTTSGVNLQRDAVMSRR